MNHCRAELGRLPAGWLSHLSQSIKRRGFVASTMLWHAQQGQRAHRAAAMRLPAAATAAFSRTGHM